MSATDLSARLQAVSARITSTAKAAGRDPNTVHLTAVSKTFAASAIAEAHQAGQRIFGENYAQELDDKAAAFSALSLAEVRFIGHLQRRKVKHLLRHPFVVAVESVDEPQLADELDKRAHELERTVEVMLQVNVGREPQKSGCPPEALSALVDHVRSLPRLRLTGLMTVPPHTEDPEGAREYFRALSLLARAHGLTELSMGMSHDLEVAIQEGATRVRVGTAIFGERAAAQPGSG